MSNLRGAFLPTTQTWPTEEIADIQGISQGMKEHLAKMYQRFNDMATMINKKDTGLYPREEFVCGKQFYPKIGLDSSSSSTPRMRQVIRKVIAWTDNLGAYKALPNNTSMTVAHGITFNADTIPVDVRATCYDPVAYKSITLPWVADDGNNISIWLDATNVNIKTTSNRTNYTVTNVIIEFLKY